MSLDSKRIILVQVGNLILNAGSNSNLICLSIVRFAVVESEVLTVQKPVCVCMCMCVCVYIYIE